MAPTRLLRPRVILATLAVVLIVAVLLTPEPDTGDQRLTTFSASPFGARGVYDLAARLGWPVRRQQAPWPAVLDTDAVYAVLGQVQPLSLRETHGLLDAVRRGAGLVYVIGLGGPLDDSLPFRRDGGDALASIARADTIACKPRSLPMTIYWFATGVNLYRLVATHPLPADTAVFLSVRGSPSGSSSGVRPPPQRSTTPAAVGYPLGRGRVVVISDPDMLRNDVVRDCQWGVGVHVVDALAWVSRDRRPSIAFDEYHQGFGSHPSLFAAIGAFLTGVPLGYTILQAVAGGLILLVALGVRAIAPRTVPRIERRSPLEHVDALARAYEQIQATRTAARRLARGLRRRHERGGWGARMAPGVADDADTRFLSAVAASHATVAADTARVLEAEREAVTPAELLAVADAIDRIDAVFPGGSGHAPAPPDPASAPIHEDNP